MSAPRFIVLEGIDGSGTTTQCALLCESLRRSGHEVVQTREPGGTELAERIRELVLAPHEPITDVTEMLLFAASRAQHVDDVIRPALLRGAIVISDRFVDSSLAYQGHGRGIGIERVRDVNALAVRDCQPGLVLDPHLPVGTARPRRDERHGASDRIEAAGDGLQERVARAYRLLAQQRGPGAELLDATRSPDQVAAAVWSAVTRRWPQLDQT